MQASLNRGAVQGDQAVRGKAVNEPDSSLDDRLAEAEGVPRRVLKLRSPSADASQNGAAEIDSSAIGLHTVKVHISVNRHGAPLD